MDEVIVTTMGTSEKIDLLILVMILNITVLSITSALSFRRKN